MVPFESFGANRNSHYLATSSGLAGSLHHIYVASTITATLMALAAMCLL